MTSLKVNKMKKITLQVTIEVPDNYQIDEPEWTLEDAMDIYTDLKITNITII